MAYRFENIKQKETKNHLICDMSLKISVFPTRTGIEIIHVHCLVVYLKRTLPLTANPDHWRLSYVQGQFPSITDPQLSL